MRGKVLKGIAAAVVVAGIAAGYAALVMAGTTPYELLLATILGAMVIALVALVLHLRAVHRALFQHAQVAYKGFMLNFFLALKGLLREREGEARAAENDLVWNLIEDYFRRETELYNTVVEELYDKSSMMHLLDRSRTRREPALGDSRPVEPLYQELHALLGRLREERRQREELAREKAPSPRSRVAGPGGAA
jgi:hypothetical protein